MHTKQKKFPAIAVLSFCLLNTTHTSLARRRQDYATDSTFSTFSSLGRLELRTPIFLQRGHADDASVHSITENEFSDLDATNDIASITRHGVELSSRAASIQSVKPVILRAKQQRSKRIEPSLSTHTLSDEENMFPLSQPLITNEVWDSMTGQEFEDEEAVEHLVRSGLKLCRSPKETEANFDEVEWTPHPSTHRLLNEHNSKESALQDGNVLVYIGRIPSENSQSIVGGDLPMVKTESILPLPASDMAALLMDSKRVTVYNKMSVGRTDLKLFNPLTKIVQNLTKPPVAKSKMISVTLMHARSLMEEDNLSNGFIVVSRAVPAMVQEEFKDLPRNDILMGANLLQDRGTQCIMTAVTHIHSPALPKMLAKSMGVSSAVNFVKDIRDSCR